MPSAKWSRCLLVFSFSVPLLLHSQESGLHRLIVGRDNNENGLAVAAPSSEAGSTKWRLRKENQTQQIEAAYRYNDWVVVFGWNGCCNGITTIIDAATGIEKLEFLTLGSYLTDQGVIVFHHWYVHFTDPSLISDSIYGLDLKMSIPNNVPYDQNQKPLDTVGVRLYPQSDQLARRHHISPDLVIAKSSTDDSIFLIDQPEASRNICFVSLTFRELSKVAQKKNCVPVATLTADQRFHVRKFANNSIGELVLTADIEAGIAYFSIDNASLVPDRFANPDATQEAFPVPWSTQRRALLRFVQPELKPSDLVTYGQSVAKYILMIDTAGNVQDAVITGIPKSLSVPIRTAVLSWKFKPTLLNGKQVEISTEFQAQLSTMGTVP